MFKIILIFLILFSINFYQTSALKLSKSVLENYDKIDNQKEFYKRFINNQLIKQVRTSDRLDRLIEILKRKNNKVKDELIQAELNEIIHSLKKTYGQLNRGQNLQNFWLIRPG